MFSYILKNKEPKCNIWRSHQKSIPYPLPLYDVWFLRNGAQQTEFFLPLDYFLPFYHPKNLENHNFEKTKKMPGDIIILHMCTINENHMMYGSWDIEWARQNFSHFGPLFTFSPPNNPINQKFGKMNKNTWRYHPFTQVYHKW